MVSHLGSGSLELLRVLNRNTRVVIHNQSGKYAHPTDLEWLFKFGHKIDNTAAVYGDHLTHNVSFACPALYDVCQFIYVIRSAKPTLNTIVSSGLYTPENALRYYTFRLRRICEMAKRTPGAVLLTWEDMSNDRCFPLLEEYLGLNTSLTSEKFEAETLDLVEHSLVEQAQESYERHLYYLKQLDLKRVE